MYDHPDQSDANDRIWASIAQTLTAVGVRDVPTRLTRDLPPDALWQDPVLLFGQACGYPLITAALPLRVLALPIYDVPGGGLGRHCSLIVARKDDPARSLADFHGCRAAVNDPMSNTGMNLFRAAIAPLAKGASFFSKVTTTGSHRASIRAVAHGDADLAAIDAVTFAGMVRFEPELVALLRIVMATPSSPTLPFVTARDTPADSVVALHSALETMIADPALADARAALSLTGILPMQPGIFAELSQMARQAEDLGYPSLT